jgi:uncharacterized protein (TIGR02246 family)
MELLVGFILGIVASIIASFVFKALESSIPLSKQKRLITFFRNPKLFVNLHRDTEERKIKELIEKLFKAWETKDIELYLSCWADDTVRIVGTDSTTKESKDEIARKFNASFDKYSDIRVEALVLDDITLGPRAGTATAKVHYRFSLTRSSDYLPIAEEAQELYSLRQTKGEWIIASNIDHFYEIGAS